MRPLKEAHLFDLLERDEALMVLLLRKLTEHQRSGMLSILKLQEAGEVERVAEIVEPAEVRRKKRVEELQWKAHKARLLLEAAETCLHNGDEQSFGPGCMCVGEASAIVKHVEDHLEMLYWSEDKRPDCAAVNEDDQADVASDDSVTEDAGDGQTATTDSAKRQVEAHNANRIAEAAGGEGTTITAALLASRLCSDQPDRRAILGSATADLSTVPDAALAGMAIIAEHLAGTEAGGAVPCG